MSNPSPNVSTRFGAGNTAAKGRQGARNLLSEKFFRDLQADFQENGLVAIRQMRQDDPSGYIAMIARLMPKELEARLQIEQKPPGNVTAEDWELIRSIIAAAKTTGASERPLEEIAPVLVEALHAHMARPVLELPALPPLE